MIAEARRAMTSSMERGILLVDDMAVVPKSAFVDMGCELILLRRALASAKEVLDWHVAQSLADAMASVGLAGSEEAAQLRPNLANDRLMNETRWIQTLRDEVDIVKAFDQSR